MPFNPTQNNTSAKNSKRKYYQEKINLINNKKTKDSPYNEQIFVKNSDRTCFRKRSNLSNIYRKHIVNDLKISNGNLNSSYHKAELYVDNLKAKVFMLEEQKKLSSQMLMKTQNEYSNLSYSIDELYSKYSALSKEVLKKKQVVNELFDQYVSSYQDIEKINTDATLETSNRKTKMKLLNETLAKQNSDYSSIASKIERMVILLITKGAVLKKNNLCVSA